MDETLLAIAVYLAAVLIALGVLCDWLPLSFPLYFPLIVLLLAFQAMLLLARLVRTLAWLARRSADGPATATFISTPRSVDLPRVIVRPPEDRQELSLAELVETLGGERPPPARFDSEGGFRED